MLNQPYWTTVIAAMNCNGFIGKNGSIPWKSKEDLKRFKATTLNQTVIMGRKTFVSLGKKPLSNRTNYVLTSDKQLTKIQPVQEGDTKLYFVNSIDDAINHFDRTSFEIYIIGGEKVYEEALQRSDLDEIHLSIINDYTYGDAMFPLYKSKNSMKQYYEEEFNIPGDPLISITKSVRLT